MTDYRPICPYCKEKVSFQHILGHILRQHPLDMLKEEGNLFHLKRHLTKPFRMVLDTQKGKSGELIYHCCLGCLSASKRLTLTNKHFPRCQEAHQKKAEELLLFWKQHIKELENKTEESPDAIVVKNVGYSQEDVYALIGAFVEHLNNNKWDEEYNKAKLFAYEEEVKDLVVVVEQYQEEGLERVIEHIEDKANEAADDIEVEKEKPSEITPLFNICQKLKLKIDDDAIKKAYEKVKNQPTKKSKEK
jgi:hypothetical protein